jgi:hypothetical protein
MRSLVREYLNEADAYARKFGKRFDQSDEIKPYIDVYEDGIIKYAVRLTGVAKLGVKPTFEYANARGIYAYPLTSAVYNDLIKADLPHAEYEDNFVIFEIKDVKRWLNVSARGKHENWKEVCKTMLADANKRLGESNKLSFEDALSSAKQGIHWSVSNGAKIWDFGYALAQLFPESQKAAVWQYMLLAAGFDGAYDGGNLTLAGTRITSLPAGLSVGGILDVRHSLINSLPAGLSVGGDLKIQLSRITSLPDGLKVGGSLDLYESRITSLPENLQVGDELSLSGTSITSLPAGLSVRGNLNLSYTRIASIPDDLQVGRSIIGFRGNNSLAPAHLRSKIK